MILSPYLLFDKKRENKKRGNKKKKVANNLIFLKFDALRTNTHTFSNNLKSLRDKIRSYFTVSSAKNTWPLFFLLCCLLDKTKSQYLQIHLIDSFNRYKLRKRL